MATTCWPAASATTGSMAARQRYHPLRDAGARESIRFDGGTLIANGPEGRDVVTGAERLSFADRVVDTNVAASVGYLYQDYMGRAATGAELVYWNGAIQSGRATAVDVREAILADPSGRAHTEATVTDLYRMLGGRAPTSGELAYWQGAVRGGQDFR